MTPAGQMIHELNTKLIEARQAYYAGEPSMSDPEYDSLEQQLAALVKQHPEEARHATVLRTVGTDPGGRIPHKSPMRSIENIYAFEDLYKWAAALGWPRYTLSGKYDGISCSLTYEGGRLVRALTRGDGDAGESILDQVNACASIPKLLPGPLNLEVRGELVIKRSRLLELNAEIAAAGGKPYMSTRNLVAGTMKLKDLAEVTKRQVLFLPWEVLADFMDFAERGGDSASERLVNIHTEFGFALPDFESIMKPEELKPALDRWAKKLEERDPEIAMDGIVLKVDSCAQRRALGLGTKFAKFQVAFKFQNAKSESVLREVIWQVGRHGKLTPVGVIDPVILAGAEVRRATLNHLNWIREMGLKIGSRVAVVRSGDVIPQITEVLE